MCLGEVGRVREVAGRDSLAVEVAGRTTIVSAMLLDAVPSPGEWVLVHSGFALGRLTEQQAREALDVRRAVGVDAT